MKSYILVGLLAFLIIAAGCTQPPQNPDQNSNEQLSDSSAQPSDQPQLQPQDAAGPADVLPPDTAPQVTEADCKQFEDVNDRDYCYLVIAMNNKDVSICETMHSTETWDHCYSSVAIILKDSDVCEKIRTQEEKETCYFIIAKDTGNASLCSHTGLSRQACEEAVAMNRPNINN
jgi:hypothetical protein